MNTAIDPYVMSASSLLNDDSAVQVGIVSPACGRETRTRVRR